MLLEASRDKSALSIEQSYLSNIDIHFVSETHATYTAAYACGVPPWTLGDGAPVATPTVALDVLKEHGTWTINGFL